MLIAIYIITTALYVTMRIISVFELNANPYRVKSLRWRIARPVITDDNGYNNKEVVQRFYNEVYPNLPFYAKLVSIINVKALFKDGMIESRWSDSFRFNDTVNYRIAILQGLLLLPYKIIDVIVSLPILVIWIPIEWVMYSNGAERKLSIDIKKTTLHNTGEDVSILNKLY